MKRFLSNRYRETEEVYVCVKKEVQKIGQQCANMDSLSCEYSV